MGRICPEKGFHIALDAAREAGVPLLLAGGVFAYPEHRRYFAEAIAPRLGLVGEGGEQLGGAQRIESDAGFRLLPREAVEERTAGSEPDGSRIRSLVVVDTVTQHPTLCRSKSGSKPLR